MNIELYTDGSSYTKDDIRQSSSGYVIYSHERFIGSGGAFFKNGTNNKGEVSAILLGLQDLESKISKIDKGLLKSPHNISVTIIGDSLITIEGCRTWIYAWIKNSKHGVLRTSSGDDVANGEIYNKIYDDYIKDGPFKLTFLHVNSHILDNSYYVGMRDTFKDYFWKYTNKIDVEPLPDKVFSNKEFRKAKDSFKKKNKMNIASTEFLRMLMHNKEADELASHYLVSNITKDRKGHISYGKKEK